MNNFHEILINQLAKESSFVTDDGELKKFIIIDAAFNMNRTLIGLLLTKPELKQKFFTEIAGHWVFDINLFVQYMENKNFLKDSYTRFRNKIGLNIGGKFLNQRNEVSLVWPFKDCILEGGQSREDQKRPEIFFNEILAQQEIDQLTEPKVLTNWKRYSVEGEKPVTELKRENGTIKENLIIKGNNLLALHSLLPQFEEQVKLIYIDPPYNTGGDSFKYNDSFNHSTWLTFMQNRLQVAHKLLHKEGSLFVQCDHHEIGYLNILLDEVFKEENKVQLIAVKTASASGFKAVNPGPIDVTEFILYYAKSKRNLKFERNYVPTGYHENYNLFVEKDDDLKNWKFIPLKEKVLTANGFNSVKEAKAKLKDAYPFLIKEMIAKFAFENRDNVVSIRDLHKPTDTVKDLQEQSRLNGGQLLRYTKQDGDSMYLYKGGALAFYSSKVKEIDGKLEVVELLSNFWEHISWAGIAKEGAVELKNGKKPEKLLKQIIDVTTNEGDIVLDYHLGSGTTCAVAHKMKRQYIGIEQLDYGKNDSTIRLQNVIGKKTKEIGEMFDKLQFDQSGISKAVNWQGGGEFVYCELKKYNQTFMEQIEEAQTSEQLLAIWEEMKAHSFLNYNVDIKKQDEAIDDFKQLSIETQKHHLCEILNKNQLYVNLSSIDDEDYQVSEKDKRLTLDFYELKEEKEVVQTKADL